MSSAIASQFSKLLLSEDQPLEHIPDGILFGLDNEFEKVLLLKENLPTASGARDEAYFLLTHGFKDTMPLFPLERGSRRTINVFSLGQYSGGRDDMFSITCEPSMLYLNLRVFNPPAIGDIIPLDDNKEDLPLTLTLLSGDYAQYGIQRNRKDKVGRTVFQFPFGVNRDTGDRLMQVIHEILICFP